MKNKKELENRVILICPICKEKPLREGYKFCSNECLKTYFNKAYENNKYMSYDEAIKQEIEK